MDTKKLRFIIGLFVVIPLGIILLPVHVYLGKIHHKAYADSQQSVLVVNK